MDGNIAFMDVAANTMGLVAKGVQNEVVIKGSIHALFSPASNKLISVDLQFDTNAFLLQIEQMGSFTEAAAAVVAHEVDALLDSLQSKHPNIETSIILIILIHQPSQTSNHPTTQPTKSFDHPIISNHPLIICSCDHQITH